MSQTEWRIVYTAADAMEAALVRNLLQRNHIEVQTANEMLAGGVGELPAGPSTAPMLRVRGTQFNNARQLIEQWANGDASPDWLCPRCGERQPGSFDLCWHCGKPA